VKKRYKCIMSTCTDMWCDANCNHVPKYCPATFCKETTSAAPAPTPAKAPTCNPNPNCKCVPDPKCDEPAPATEMSVVQSPARPTSETGDHWWTHWDRWTRTSKWGWTQHLGSFHRCQEGADDTHDITQGQCQDIAKAKGHTFLSFSTKVDRNGVMSSQCITSAKCSPLKGTLANWRIYRFEPSPSDAAFVHPDIDAYRTFFKRGVFTAPSYTVDLSPSVLAKLEAGVIGAEEALAVAKSALAGARVEQPQPGLTEPKEGRTDSSTKVRALAKPLHLCMVCDHGKVWP